MEAGWSEVVVGGGRNNKKTGRKGPGQGEKMESRRRGREASEGSVRGRGVIKKAKEWKG